MKLGQGNIFSSMCQEFCPQEGEYLGRYPFWAGTPPRQGHPPGQVQPPGRYTPGRYPWAGTPPVVNEWALPILLECILFNDYLGRYPPLGRYTPWAGTASRNTPLRQVQPPGQVHPRQVPPGQQVHPPVVNEWALPILLECILFNDSVHLLNKIYM